LVALDSGHEWQLREWHLDANCLATGRIQPAISFFGSSADGRLIIEGGEYNFFVPTWTNLGAIYDPLANAWTSVDPPPFFGTCCGFNHTTIGDAQSVILSDGTYMQANCCTPQAALLDAATLTWTPTGSGKFDLNDEEGWTLLSNKQVLTVDAYVFSCDPNGTNSEIYVPAAGKGTVREAPSCSCGTRRRIVAARTARLRRSARPFYALTARSSLPERIHAAAEHPVTRQSLTQTPPPGRQVRTFLPISTLLTVPRRSSRMAMS
jgi:hypothetical protein